MKLLCEKQANLEAFARTLPAHVRQASRQCVPGDRPEPPLPELMTSPKDSKPAAVVTYLSEKAKREKHRNDSSAFLWGTWIMLFGAVAFGHQALQGFRTGKWVDLSAKGWGYLVPWWVAAALSFGFLLSSLWCFREYLKLKNTVLKYEPGNEGEDGE